MDLEKSFFKMFLKEFEGVCFKVKFWDGEEVIVGDEEPKFQLYLKKPLKKKDILTSTSLCFGEAYMNGDIEIEGDMFVVFDELLKCIDKFHTNFNSLTKIFNVSTSMKKQKEEVTSHYDLGNNFYKLWLDDTLSYSCAYFMNENDSLHNAQINKINYILKKLNLEKGMTLLDIGCGWGGLLIEAAKQYKVKGMGITLSKEQYIEFKRRIEEENLQELLEVKIMDYRELHKLDVSFDRVVSVGMLEHVGRENYNLFFKNVDSILKKGGVFLLHYISTLKESEGDAWLRKYIFPGGVIPSLREIVSISSNYQEHVIDIESLRLHYVKTLLNWGQNFDNSTENIKAIFDDKFIRMWRMYLYSCAAAFNNGIVDLHQILLVKGVNNKLPITREYLYRE